MRKLWNTLLGPVLIFLGTIIAPKYIIVADSLTYVWIILLQIPVAVVVALVSAIIVGVLAHGIAMTGSPARLVLLIVFIIFSGTLLGALGFFFMDKILTGLTINGLLTYIVLGILYGTLAADYNVKEG